jgi:hypothetical protein
MSDSNPKLPLIKANIRQEIGIMIGFMAVFVIVISCFALVWRAQNAKQSRAEAQLKRGLQERGFGIGGGFGGKGAGRDEDLWADRGEGAEVEYREREREGL